MNATKPGTFNSISVSIISVLVTGVIALMIALASATKPVSYDRDQAFIKSSIQTNADNIKSLTAAVEQLAVTEAQTETRVQYLESRLK